MYEREKEKEREIYIERRRRRSARETRLFNPFSSHSIRKKRSPWTNKYDPPLSDGATPSKELRAVEVAANEIFDIYRDLYYEGGVSSSYCWDLDDGFASVVLIKKSRACCIGREKNKQQQTHSFFSPSGA